jgi:hypothetical protein
LTKTKEELAQRQGMVKAYRRAAELARAAATEWEIPTPKAALEELAYRLEQLAQLGEIPHA